MTVLGGTAAAPGIASPGFFSPGSLELPSPAPGTSSGEFYFSAVPGLAIPGRFTIAFDGKSGLPYYQYIGHLVLYYLDYIDGQTEKTLTAYPGNIYGMFPVSSRAGLSEPPPDGRWGSPAAPSYDEDVFFPEEDLPAEILELEALYESSGVIERARIRNTSIQVMNSRKEFRQFPFTGRITVIRKKKPEPLSGTSLMLAEARELNVRLQAGRK